MRKVIERKDHTTLVEVQSYVGFVITPWTNIGTPSLQQLNSARKIRDVVSGDDQPDLPDRICAHRARRWHNLARYLRCDNYKSLTTIAPYCPIAKYLEGFYTMDV